MFDSLMPASKIQLLNKEMRELSVNKETCMVIRL